MGLRTVLLVYSKECSHDAIATAIFYCIRLMEFTHGEILMMTINKLQSQSHCVNSPLEEDHALRVHHFDRKIDRSIDFFDQNLN